MLLSIHYDSTLRMIFTILEHSIEIFFLLKSEIALTVNLKEIYFTPKISLKILQNFKTNF